MAILELRDVRKSFAPGFIPRRREVLHGLSLAVEEGEIFGFLGPNGAGKTTTIKLIVGLLFPDRGDIRIAGISSREPRARASLGFLPENPYFYDDLSGAEFLDFYGRLYGLDAATRARRSAELLERMSLGHAARTALRHYSKGMVQRIGFAQALLAEPRLLILDEPMSGLDPVGRRDFRDLMLEARGRGATVFFSTHILQDVEMICDRVAIVAAGTLKSVGRLDQLLAGRGAGVEVEIAGDLPVGLGVAPEVVARAHGKMLLRLKNESEAELLVDAVRSSGGHVLSMVPARVTLEELFLREAGAKAGGGAR